MNYQSFIREKLRISESIGITTELREYSMFPHQRDLTTWALRRGRMFLGIELKTSYYQQAVRNLEKSLTHTLDMFQ